MEMMRYAYVHRNLRHLSFEKKVILGAHAITVLACFFPWYSAAPPYEEEFSFWAFSSYHYLIGSFVFLISLVLVLLFVERLFEKKIVKLPINENWLYAASGAQQLLLIILAWSVITYYDSQWNYNGGVAFGLFLIFVAQVAGLVATFLNYQLERQQAVAQFFQHPEPKSDKPKHDQS